MASLPQLKKSPPTGWQQHGLCRAIDSDVFFPPPWFEHKPDREAREARAKRICARCPVRLPCLDWALATREPFGVWGGRSESERRRILGGKLKAS
ncbi:MAG: WhiB family transcriptional regulator [Actinobacteria bacterium]|nr:WhiB family transcriptional regulator [Actinomycetota bacterium]